MEKLSQIVSNGTLAKLDHVCNGKISFLIETTKHSYALEINSMDEEWKNIYIMPQYAAITLMRWIRKDMESNDGTFVMLK